MTSLAAIIAVIATVGVANENVHDTTGSPTQQEIKHIFSAANALMGYSDDELPARTQTFYAQWPNVLPGARTTHDIPVVDSLAVSGGNFLADTRGIHQVTEQGADIVWREIQENRDMTLDAINIDLFGDVRGLDVIDTSDFRTVHFWDAGEAAPTLQDTNNGIVGDAIDAVIQMANTANWNAVRANGASAAGIALANTDILNDVLNERIAINNVLNEYDEAVPRIMDGLL